MDVTGGACCVTQLVPLHSGLRHVMIMKTCQFCQVLSFFFPLRFICDFFFYVHVCVLHLLMYTMGAQEPVEAEGIRSLGAVFQGLGATMQMPKVGSHHGDQAHIPCKRSQLSAH